MVIAFAGRRTQSLGVGAAERLRPRLTRLLAALAPSAVVGAASDGGDLLVLETALSIRPTPAPHVVLPTPEAVFSEDSVIPAARARFESVLARARALGSVSSIELADGEEAYRRGNAAILEHAERLAGSEERAVGLVLARAGEGQMVEDFARIARLHGMPVVRLDPEVDLEARPKCFVAMPYGTKYDPQRRIEVDCNAVYQKILVPALENAQLRYRRGDEEIDSGVVLRPMIEWLAGADLVIGDLTTGNFNVGWELGLRHLTRPAHTLLMLARGTVAPFDVTALRHVAYRNDSGAIDDDSAIDAWSALAPYLGRLDATGESDSPVDAVTEVERWALVKPRRHHDERFEAARGTLALARDLGNGDLMKDVLTAAAGIGGEEETVLRAEAGVGLVRLGRFRDARDLLADLIAHDSEASHPEAHVFYAQALYRPEDATIADYDAAEGVLERLLLRRPAHPEVRALLGAIAKRRSWRRKDPSEREPDLRLALKMYRHDYERNLDAFYEGINVVAIGTALGLLYGDSQAAASARELLPAVELAARLAKRRVPSDFWAAVTAAEARLHALLLGLESRLDVVINAYREAADILPAPGDVDSSLNQLEWLAHLGIDQAPLTAVAGALRPVGRSGD